MATEDPDKIDPPKDDVDPPADPPEDDPEGEGEGGDKKDPPMDPELAKAIKRRDAANAAKNKALEEVAALKAKYEKDKTDPLAVANTRLVKAEARTVLTDAGVAKEDHATVMRYLDLESVAVDNDGNVDTDAIQDAVDDLRKVFGKAKDAKRTPRIDTRDKGGNGTKAPDPASARRRAMLGYS